jgi:hypothetical protein
MSRHRARLTALLAGMVTAGCAHTWIPVERAEELVPKAAQRGAGAGPDATLCRVLPNRTAPITLKDYDEIPPDDRWDVLDQKIAQTFAGRHFWYIVCRPNTPMLGGEFYIFFDAENGHAIIHVGQ